MKLNPSRFEVRQPAPDYSRRTDVAQIVWIVAALLIICAGVLIDAFIS